MRSPRTSGFTLIEVALAIAILGLVTVSLMSASARMIRGVTDDRTETLASAAVDARLAAALQWPTYRSLDSAYAGVEPDTPQPGFLRTTTVVRTGGPGLDDDFKRVTVTVSGPRMESPVSRTITIAAP